MIKIDFNKVLNLFKNGRYITILDNKKNGEQWISNGMALYNIGNTEFDSINILPVLPGRSESWQVESNYTYTYSELDFEDTASSDEDYCDRIAAIEIIYNEEIYIPFVSPNREVMFINKKFLKPFNYEKNGEIAFYARKSRIYGYYLAVKEGLILKGIVLPMKLVEKDKDTHFFKNLETLYKVCSLKYYSSTAEDTKEKEEENEGDDWLRKL